ncbi:MAG: hypothetical protein Q8P52_01665 [bacterium]|nr:hypothetical protein [bacterium]
MAINVEVLKNANENSISLIRRFTRRVQGSGVLPKLKSLRFRNRKNSDYKKKRQTLKKIARRAEIAKLIKLGKISENNGRRHFK